MTVTDNEVDDRVRVAALTTEIAHLRRALANRDAIGMAKGVTMAQTGCSAEEAFTILVRQSQRRNVKLLDVVAEVLARYAAHPSP